MLPTTSALGATSRTSYPSRMPFASKALGTKGEADAGLFGHAREVPVDGNGPVHAAGHGRDDEGCSEGFPANSVVRSTSSTARLGQGVVQKVDLFEEGRLVTEGHVAIGAEVGVVGLACGDRGWTAEGWESGMHAGIPVSARGYRSGDDGRPCLAMRARQPRRRGPRRVRRHSRRRQPRELRGTTQRARFLAKEQQRRLS